METLRQVGHFKLNKGDGMARGLYNLTNQILLDYTVKEGCSLWFDEERKDELLAMSDTEFLKAAKEDAGNDIYSDEVRDNLYNAIAIRLEGGVVMRENFNTRLGKTFYKGETFEEVKGWMRTQFK